MRTEHNILTTTSHFHTATDQTLCHCAELLCKSTHGSRPEMTASLDSPPHLLSINKLCVVIPHQTVTGAIVPLHRLAHIAVPSLSTALSTLL
jgi:hypothetical protein